MENKQQIDQQTQIKVFEDKKVRTLWNGEIEEWYFSVIDVIAVLTDSENPRRYWSDLKRKLNQEGSQLYEKIVQLKLPSSDGKSYKTDCMTTEQLFRLIQSVPSPKAEPFKLWMATVAKERLDQMQDPELSIEQAMLDYKRLGYSDNWICLLNCPQRKSRNRLTRKHFLTISRMRNKAGKLLEMQDWNWKRKQVKKLFHR